MYPAGRIPMTRCAAIAVMLCLALAAPAQEVTPANGGREGSFEVRSASSSVVDGVHILDARLQLVLSSEAHEALESGLPLTIEVQVQFIRSRRFFVDDVDAEVTRRFELSYRQLEQRYVLHNAGTGFQESFATLYSALNSLGRIQGWPVVDDSVLDSDRPYRVRVRAMLQTRQYPAALRMVFFWRSQWQLQSDWFEWSLER